MEINWKLNFSSFVSFRLTLQHQFGTKDTSMHERVTDVTRSNRSDVQMSRGPIGPNLKKIGPNLKKIQSGQEGVQDTRSARCAHVVRRQRGTSRAQGAGLGAAVPRYFTLWLLFRSSPRRKSDRACEHHSAGAPGAHARGVDRLQVNVGTVQGPEEHVPCLQP